MRRLGALICVSLAFGVAGAGGAAPGPGELVFSSSRAPDFHDEIYLLDTHTGERRNLSQNATADHHPVASPDGGVVAFASDRGGRGEAIWVVGPDGRGLRRLHRPLDGFMDVLRWSPDGKRLALQLDHFNRPSATYVVPATGGVARRIAAGSFDVAWVSAGTLAVSGPVGVTVRDLSGKTLWRRPGIAVAVSGRGELALASQGRLEVVSSRGIRRATVLGSIPVAWSPDGSILAYTGRSGGIRLLDARSHVRVLAARLTLSGGWAPNGRSLLAVERDSFRPVSVSLAGRVSRVGVENGTWSRTGTQLLGTGAAARVSVWRPGGRPRALTGPQLQEPCAAFYSAPDWLDDRRAVVEFGRGGQQQADVWVTDRSGSAPRRLVGGSAWASAPEWSRAGAQIVYESGDVITHGGGCDGPLTPQLRVVSANGAGDTALTPADGHRFQLRPRWSPDASKVAFHRTDLSDSEEFGVFVLSVASGALQRLSTGFGESVSWAPDGERIAFSGRGGVWIADVGTGTVKRTAAGERPEWSPDGAQIAYVRAGELWATGPDGTDARRLAEATPVGALRWAPDGSLLAFGVREGILVVGRDGTTRRRILQPGAHDPSFSRDGRTIAFVAPVGEWSRGAFNGSLRTELFVAGTTSGAARRLTHDFANIGAPSWR